MPQTEPHVWIGTFKQSVGYNGGSEVNVSLLFQQERRSMGRFRLSVTDAERPLALEPLAKILPIEFVGAARIVFDDDENFFRRLDQGAAKLSPTRGLNGRLALRVSGPDRRFHQSIPQLAVPIRKEPKPGECRYLRFAWRKVGGEMLAIEIGHDNQIGPAGDKKFRYQAAPLPSSGGAALVLDKKLPGEWTVVTRDLAEDFGDFSLTGLGLVAQDGEYAEFDQILLAPTIADLDKAK